MTDDNLVAFPTKGGAKTISITLTEEQAREVYWALDGMRDNYREYASRKRGDGYERREELRGKADVLNAVAESMNSIAQKAGVKPLDWFPTDEDDEIA